MQLIHVLGVCLLLGSIILYRRRSNSIAAKLPPGPPGLPIIGNMLDLKRLQTAHDKAFERDLEEKYGDMYTLWVGSTHMIIVNDPCTAHELLDKRGAIYSSRPHRNNFREHTNQWRLLTEPSGDVFRTIRRIYTSLVGPKQSASFEKHQDYESKVVLMNILEEPETFLKQAARFSFSVIFSATYGLRLTTLDHPIMKELSKTWEEILHYFHPGTLLIDYIPLLERLPLWAQPWFGKAKTLRYRELKIQKAFFDVLKKQVADGTPPDCAGTLFLKMQEKEGISDEHACDILTHLQQGGADTTLHILEFFFKIMALHPDVAKKAQAEIDAVIGPDRLPNFHDKDSLPYVRSLIKELHRWNAIGFGVPHVNVADDEYRGYRIPAGSIIIANLATLGRNREHWGDTADIFDPARHMQDELTSHASAMQSDVMKRDHFHFGFGRRLCPGIWVADSNLYIFIVRMLWAFDMRPLPGDEGKLSMEDKIYDILIKPKPYKVSITPRTPAHADAIRREMALSQSDLPTFDHVRV